MNHKLIITNYNNGIAEGLFDGSRAVELSFYEKEPKSILGNIYIGKVANIAKNIQAAFVEIEGGIPCYYSLEKETMPVILNRQNAKRIAAGDEFLVQVSRESVKTKAPSVTSNISLSGKYLVLTSGKTNIAASSKLSKQQKERLISLMEPYRSDQYGWIIRTNAADVSETELIKEADGLIRQMEGLRNAALHRTARTCLYRNPPQWILPLKNLYSNLLEEIVTDDPKLYEAMTAYLTAEQPQDLNKLRLYKDDLLPLYRLYPFEREFHEALSERVWLKSGGYLVIQPTEALTAIDVNTGKCESGKKAQDTFYKINLEAAKEIARQLRLRNLSGMILVDFINMADTEREKQLLKEFTEVLNTDPVKACVVDITKLGLVEVTRKRVQNTLAEKIKNHRKC